MEKILETGFYCHTCKCVIKDEDLASWECGQCDSLDNWEPIEIVLRSKTDVKNALKRVNDACEKICLVNAELDE
jgi:hypothetical protein